MRWWLSWVAIFVFGIVASVAVPPFVSPFAFVESGDAFLFYHVVVAIFICGFGFGIDGESAKGWCFFALSVDIEDILHLREGEHGEVGGGFGFLREPHVFAEEVVFDVVELAIVEQ